MHCYRVGRCFPDADISFRRLPTARYVMMTDTAFKLFRFSVAADINRLFATTRRNADRYPITDRLATLTRCDQGQITADIVNICLICHHGFTGYGHVVCTGHGQYSADSCTACCFHHYINIARSGGDIDRQIADNCLQDRQGADIRAACKPNWDIIDHGTVDKHTLAVDDDTGISPFIFLAQSGSTVRQTYHICHSGIARSVRGRSQCWQCHRQYHGRGHSRRRSALDKLVQFHTVFSFLFRFIYGGGYALREAYHIFAKSRTKPA